MTEVRQEIHRFHGRVGDSTWNGATILRFGVEFDGDGVSLVLWCTPDADPNRTRLDEHEVCVVMSDTLLDPLRTLAVAHGLELRGIAGSDDERDYVIGEPGGIDIYAGKA